MWWSNNDQDWAKNTLTRSVDVPNADDAKFWMWNNYVIEKDWDYGFVEVSTDGGNTWTEQPVFDEAGPWCPPRRATATRTTGSLTSAARSSA